MSINGHHYTTCDALGCNDPGCYDCLGGLAQCSNCELDANSTPNACLYANAHLGQCLSRSREQRIEALEPRELDFNE